MLENTFAFRAANLFALDHSEGWLNVGGAARGIPWLTTDLAKPQPRRGGQSLSDSREASAGRCVVVWRRSSGTASGDD
ncbi:hypothetical protein N7527_011377 [Penicillium freii]|nr:hypothetical protein N7527_011377 [Penicillium freii]